MTSSDGTFVFNVAESAARTADPSPSPQASAKTEQRMGEAIFGPDYTGPATAEAKAEPHNYDPYAPTTWGHYDEEMTVPSGQKCRVRKLDFQTVMEAGMLDKLNTLQGVVGKHIKKGEGQPPVDPMKLLGDKRTAKQFSGLIDDVVVMVVTAPKLEIPPSDFAKRKPGVVYVDTVGLVDKMEIFGHALGDINSLVPFRGGAAEPTDSVADEQSDGRSS